MSEKMYLPYFGFDGGLNTSASPDNLLENELMIARNCVLRPRGGIDIREGTTRVNTQEFGNSQITCMYEYRKNNGNVYKIVCSGTTMYLWDGTVVKNDFNNTDFDFCVFNDKLYFVNGNAYYVYDGATVQAVTPKTGTDYSDLSQVKRCKYIERRGDRLFASGDPQNPNRLYFSDPGDPTAFKTASSILASTEDGDIIVGMKEFHGLLLVFKKRSIYAWSGYDPTVDVQFKRLNVHMGAVNNKVICRAEDNLIYLGEDGVYTLTGTYPEVIATEKISKDIIPTIGGLINKKNACAIFYNGAYYLSVCDSGSYNNKILVFFYDIWKGATPTEKGVPEPWVVWDNLFVSSFIVSLDDDKMYMGKSNSGYILKYGGVLNDEGERIQFEIETAPLSQGSPIHEKKYKAVYFALQQFELLHTALHITAYVDAKEQETDVVVSVHSDILADETFIWGRSTWGSNWGQSTLASRKMLINKKGNRISLNIQNGGVNEPLSLYGIGVQFKVKKPS